MTQTTTAVYEKGILRSLQPLHLREGQAVRIRILSELTGADDAPIRSLVGAGPLTPPPGRSDVESLSEQAQRELADRLGRAPGKSLSQIIIEDRGER